MKKYKVFLTMEFTADVEAETEEDAREALRRAVEFYEISGYANGSAYDVQNIKVKRYWGGGNEILNDGNSSGEVSDGE